MTKDRDKAGVFSSYATSLDTQKVLEQRTRELAESEARYRLALKAGRLVHWETDLVTRERFWTAEAMTLFGLDLPGGVGRFGGDEDEFRRALHPDDRSGADKFYEKADEEDWFPAEYRIIKPDGEVRWFSGGGLVVRRTPEGRAARLMNVVADITERKLVEEHNKLLMRELSHRAKNLLAVIIGIASQTGRNTPTFDDFRMRFEQRLKGLATSHDLLLDEGWEGASLFLLVKQQLVPFAELGFGRVEVDGPEVMLNPKAAEALGMGLHELATNAVKYGALSAEDGRINIGWGWDAAADNLLMHWIETGGPPVAKPEKQGFGYTICNRVISDHLGGHVQIEFPSEGLRWTVSIPRTHVTKRSFER